MSGVAIRVLRHASLILHSSFSSTIWAARAIALLLGVGLALALEGYTAIFRSIFGSSPTVALLVTGVGFVSAAAGPWAARRAAMSLVGMWAQATSGAFPFGSASSESHGRREAPALGGMAWLLQSMLGAALGVLLLAGLAGSGGVRYAWSVLSADFFWTPVTEAICLCLLVAVVIVPAGMTAGLQLATLCSAVLRGGIAGQPGPDGVGGAPRITASLLAGVSVGLAVHRWNSVSGLSAERWVLLAAVPAFGISVLSVLIARRMESLPDAGSSSAGSRLAYEPTSAMDGNAHRLVLLSVAGWGLATGLWSCALWSAGSVLAGGAASGQAGWTLAALAGGAWAVGWPPGRQRCSIGGFGMALWAGGAAILLAVAGTSRDGAFRWTIFGLPPAQIATAICLGYALPYGRRTFVERRSSERQALAQWAAAVLCGLVAGMFAQYGFAAAAGSDVVAMTAACLLLLIFGGLLLIHDRSEVRRVRQRRVGLVFASLALAVMVLPSAARRASARMDASAWADGPAVGAAGLTGAERSGHSRWAETLNATFGWAAPGAQIASIGNVVFIPERGVGRIDHVLWAPPVVSGNRVGLRTEPVSLSGPPKVYTSADAWWRRGRSRYDLIVQMADGLSPAEMPARLSWEWFEGLRRRLLPKGTLLVELPLALLGSAAAESASETFAAVFEAYDPWLVVVGLDADQKAYLLATTGASMPPDAALGPGWRLPGGAWASFRRLSAAEDTGRRPRLNTLRTPAFRLGPNDLANQR